MRWLWFVGTLGCLAIAFRTHSMGLAALCLIGALVFMVVGTLAVAAQRIDNSRGDSGRLIGPEEIRQMREAEARRKTTQAGADPPAIVGVAAVGAMLASEAATRDDTGPEASPDMPTGGTEL